MGNFSLSFLKLKKLWLYGGLIGVGLTIGAVSIHKAAVDGFYRKINLNRDNESYLGEVDRRGLEERLSIEKNQNCWWGSRMEELDRLKCGQWWLAQGKVKRGVYELIKGMKSLETKMLQGDCQFDEWQQVDRKLEQILGLVGGNTHDALAKELRLLQEIAKEKCGW